MNEKNETGVPVVVSTPSIAQLHEAICRCPKCRGEIHKHRLCCRCFNLDKQIDQRKRAS